MATECDNPAECTAAERSGPESSRCLLWTALALADCFDDLAEAAHRLGTRLSVDASRWSLADLEETLRYLVVGVDAAGAIEPPKALREGRRDGEQTFELNGQAAAVRALAQASLKALVLSRSSLATLGIPWESCDHLCVTTVTQALRRSTSEPFDAAERDEDQPPAEAPVSTLASWMTPYRAVDPTTLPQDLAEAILAVVAVEQPSTPSGSRKSCSPTAAAIRPNSSAPR